MKTRSRSSENQADVWRDAHHLDDDELAGSIMADKIDTLVDLTMHVTNGRSSLFTRRPAAVQIAWIAYLGSTGSSAIDYCFTHPWLAS
ncbi:O-linked N-acetylglucosamine transferase family protein [Caballeronia glebae]